MHRTGVGIPTNTGGSSRVDALSLAWRPDGKMIAVGLSNGQVNVYDYRDGSVVYVMANPYPSRSVSDAGSGMTGMHCLKWADIYLGQSTSVSLFDSHRSPKSILETLPLLSQLPLSSMQQQMMLARSMFNKSTAQGGTGPGGFKSAPIQEADIDGIAEESSDVMNVLFAGDNQSCFKLRMFGEFETGSISLLDLMGVYGNKNFKLLDILKADIQADLSELVIIAAGSRLQDRTSSTEDIRKGDRCLLQITVSSELLHRHSLETRTLGLKQRPVNFLLRYLSDGFQVMRAEYRKITQMAEDCIESVQRALTDNGEMTAPTYEFIQLLMTGRPSPSMDHYLQQELRRHGLRRWDKSVKAAYSNMQKVAFECLLPACERLLIHLSDILGCSRWTDRYRPLQLEEGPVYNCIKIVGDFVGLLERLFIVLKMEMKQFSEFENWLEQEVLQPTIRGVDDHGEDEAKKFPPIDILSVSEYLKSGLANKELEKFFQELDEMTAPTEDIDSANPEASKSYSSKTETNESVDAALGYKSKPSYPIVYSFSEKLLDIVRVRETVETAVPDALQASSSSQKKSGNPFSGAAVTAALAGRGFGPLTSKNPGSSSLFAKSNSKNETMQPADSSGGSTTKAPFTLEKHLKLMMRHCQSIFEGPSEAVAKSFKIVHTLELPSPSLSKIYSVSTDAVDTTADADVHSDTWEHLNFHSPGAPQDTPSPVKACAGNVTSRCQDKTGPKTKGI
ncbi:Anaphase-promoting complex subunit 4 [Gamsiella multidivaricata]|nr:Anaphase-promoting complex subunit 4 [Gamsiella multidivaricata]